VRVLQAIVPPRELRPGGAEGVVLHLSRALQARGHSVVVAATAGRPFTKDLEQLDIDVRPMRLSGKLNVLAALALARVARAESADVLHAHLSTAGVLAGVAGRIAGIPTVATVHGMTHPFYYRMVDHIVAVSEAVSQHLLRCGVTPRRITVVKNGVDASLFGQLPTREHARSMFGLPLQAQTVGSVGRLSEAKGHKYLLRAVALLRQRYPELRVMIVGGGEKLPCLLSEAEQLGIASHVMFAGYRKDVDVVLAALDLYVQPSLEEGLGLAVMEAMAARVPVVGTRVGGIPELIEDGRTGLLVPARDPALLADAIARLLTDARLRARLADAARAHVRMHHTWPRAAEQVELVYQSLLEQRGAATAPGPTTPDV